MTVVPIVAIVGSNNDNNLKSYGLPRKNATLRIPNNCELGDLFEKEMGR
jgi:hypothetical protein